MKAEKSLPYALCLMSSPEKEQMITESFHTRPSCDNRSHKSAQFFGHFYPPLLLSVPLINSQCCENWPCSFSPTWIWAGKVRILLAREQLAQEKENLQPFVQFWEPRGFSDPCSVCFRSSSLVSQANSSGNWSKGPREFEGLNQLLAPKEQLLT